ncbi:aminotransferase class V-fold PLP-dependent enzyme [Candidatus Venteria ishoeyi]|uniref:Putative cysteine desulfurase n=1 Tax=Candidatus Venteria ishoeyi TaxID=1899563 RepID=A0A1H6FE46_9GAMM|nr:aminotransferase class V-fold PLP-dependent enzyme [Candidatus Venteria ishoeyi]SEH07681.1 putative cysteine desulfurase [Candidatus Venteria ishoeyi]
MNEFQQKPDLYYLNHAAVSPWPQRTADAVIAFAKENQLQGAQDYPRWMQMEQTLRAQLQRLINAPSAEDIALLKNTSEALSVVAAGINWKVGDNIVSSNQEFPSNRIVWQALESQGVNFRQADISGNDPEAALFSLVDNNTRLIAISSVQYASGLRLDLEKIGQFCKQKQILFCVDAIQSLGALACDAQKIHADFLMADGHKWLLGPEGLALFYCTEKQRKKLKLNQFGWHMVEDFLDFNKQEWEPADSARRFECGSANMLAIQALSASLSLIEEVGIEVIEKKVLENARYLQKELSKIKGVVVYFNKKSEYDSGIVNFSLENGENELLHQYLMQRQVVCALRGKGVRFSAHFYTPKNIMDEAVNRVKSYLS